MTEEEAKLKIAENIISSSYIKEYESIVALLQQTLRNKILKDESLNTHEKAVKLCKENVAYQSEHIYGVEHFLNDNSELLSFCREYRRSNGIVTLDLYYLITQHDDSFKNMTDSFKNWVYEQIMDHSIRIVYFHLEFI